jgi:hypothetical protein
LLVNAGGEIPRLYYSHDDVSRSVFILSAITDHKLIYTKVLSVTSVYSSETNQPEK